MNPSKIDALLAEMKDLPPRRAPRSLEARVRARLEALERQPWWERSWANWPTWAQQGFSGVAAGVAAGVAVAVEGAWRGIDLAAVAHQRLPGLFALVGAAARLARSAGSLVSAVPVAWLGAWAGIALVSAAVLAEGGRFAWNHLPHHPNPNSS